MVVQGVRLAVRLAFCLTSPLEIMYRRFRRFSLWQIGIQHTYVYYMDDDCGWIVIHGGSADVRQSTIQPINQSAYTRRWVLFVTSADSVKPRAEYFCQDWKTFRDLDVLASVFFHSID